MTLIHPGPAGSAETATGQRLPPIRIPPTCVQLDGEQQPGISPAGTAGAAGGGGGGRREMRGKIVEECHIGLVQLKPGQPVVVDDMPAPATPEVSQHTYIHTYINQQRERSPQPPTHYSYIIYMRRTQAGL